MIKLELNWCEVKIEVEEEGDNMEKLNYLDYVTVAYSDLLITILFLALIGLAIIIWWGDNRKISVATFVIGTVASCIIAVQVYDNNLEESGTLFNYKVAIETGVDNGFTKLYYEKDEGQRADINRKLQSLDIATGKLAVKYGFGATDSERLYLKLYIESMLGLYLTPLLIPILLISGGCGIAYFWDRANRILSVNKRELITDVSNLRQSARKLEEEITQLNIKKSELDPDVIAKEYIKQQTLIKDNESLTSKNESLSNENEKLSNENEKLSSNNKILGDEIQQKEERLNVLNRKLYRESKPETKKEKPIITNRFINKEKAKETGIEL